MPLQKKRAPKSPFQMRNANLRLLCEVYNLKTGERTTCGQGRGTCGYTTVGQCDVTGCAECAERTGRTTVVGYTCEVVEQSVQTRLLFRAGYETTNTYGVLDLVSGDVRKSTGWGVLVNTTGVQAPSVVVEDTHLVLLIGQDDSTTVVRDDVLVLCDLHTYQDCPAGEDTGNQGQTKLCEFLVQGRSGITDLTVERISGLRSDP